MADRIDLRLAPAVETLDGLLGSRTFDTRYIGGGASLYFSDLLGNRNLVTGLQVNGGLEDITALVGYLVSEATRPIFAAFLATALAITAMPVIAKILIDLNLIRRNLGVIILSAGVIDDTIGWLVLSVIAGVDKAEIRSRVAEAAKILDLTDYLERHPESLLRGKPDDAKIAPSR